MYDLGYLQQIDHADLPTVFENILPQFEKSTTDPDRKYSIPWQGGQTGIWSSTRPRPRRSHSVTDLFDPKYKGKVDDADRDDATRCRSSCRARGSIPNDATKEDWLAAIDKLQRGAAIRDRSAGSPATTTPRT